MQLPRPARIAGTGLSFAVFGICGLLLALGVFPLVRLRAPDRDTGERRAQRWIQRDFRFFVGFMRALGLIEVRLEGEERLAPPGQLLVANHPSLIDVVILGSRMPQMDCVVKKAAWSNPFMAGVVGAAGYVPNDLGEELIAEGAARLRAGRSLLLFPEGTRSPKGGLGPFRRGAAHIALEAGVRIVPIFIHLDPPGLMRGQKWWDVPERRMRYRIEVGDPIDPALLAPPGSPRGAGTRRVTAALRDFFEKRLQTLGSREGACTPETKSSSG